MVLLPAGTFLTQRPAAAPDAAELHLLAVGRAQCAVLRTPSGRTLLLDAGTQTGEEVHRTLIPALHALRLPMPREAIVSHANTDHYNLLDGYIRHRGLELMRTNQRFGLDDPVEAPNPPALLNTLRAHAGRLERMARGDELTLDDRTHLRVLWPPAPLPEPLEPNDRSLVLRIECDGLTLLAPGDADDFAQNALLEDPAQLAADVLILPHHGGWERTLPEFVAAVDPQIVLVSCHRPPRPPISAPAEAAAFYRELFRTRKVYMTSRAGYIRCTFGRGRVNVQGTQ